MPCLGHCLKWSKGSSDYRDRGTSQALVTNAGAPKYNGAATAYRPPLRRESVTALENPVLGGVFLCYKRPVEETVRTD